MVVMVVLVVMVVVVGMVVVVVVVVLVVAFLLLVNSATFQPSVCYMEQAAGAGRVVADVGDSSLTPF